MGRKVCLIDYENTALLGLAGLENLSDGDCVRIICSNENITNTLGKTMKIYEKAGILVQAVYMNPGEKREKNALDFRLCCDLGYFIAQSTVSEVYVISSDKGYHNAILEANKLNPNVLIVQGASIQACLDKNAGASGKKTGEKKPAQEGAAKQKEPETKAANPLYYIKDKMQTAGKKKNENIPAAKPKNAGPKSEKTKNEKNQNTEPKNTEAAEKFANMTATQKKKLQQQIKKYIEENTSVPENYATHLAALVVKEQTVMDFRRAAKKILGKKSEVYEADIVKAYMYFHR